MICVFTTPDDGRYNLPRWQVCAIGKGRKLHRDVGRMFPLKRQALAHARKMAKVFKMPVTLL